MNGLVKRRRMFRTRIELRAQSDVRCWTKALGIPPDDLKRVIEKVGNSVAAVRKEIHRAAARS
jgi:hypothetical protein